MQAKLKQWSLHAVYENEANGQVAHILSILIGASWGVFLFVILIGLYDNDWKVTSGTLVGCVLLIVPLELLRRQRSRASSLIFVLIVLGTLTLIATVRLGIRDLAIVAFPIVLILAGMILSRGLFRLCVGLTVLAVCWLAMGETNGPYSSGG